MFRAFIFTAAAEGAEVARREEAAALPAGGREARAAPAHADGPAARLCTLRRVCSSRIYSLLYADEYTVDDGLDGDCHCVQDDYEQQLAVVFLQQVIRGRAIQNMVCVCVFACACE